MDVETFSLLGFLTLWERGRTGWGPRSQEGWQPAEEKSQWSGGRGPVPGVGTWLRL